MGLFDFMKKDKKEESKKLDKNNDNNESKFNKSKSKGFFNRKSDNNEDINPFDKAKITENEYKLAKKRRQEKDVRTDDEKIKDSAMKDMALNHKNRNNRIAAVMELKSQDILEDITFNHKDKFVRTVAVSRITDPEILEEITALAEYSDVRQIAFEKLDQIDLAFGELAKFEKDKKIASAKSMAL